MFWRIRLVRHCGVLKDKDAPSVMLFHPKKSVTTDAVSSTVATNEPSIFMLAP